MGGVDKILEGKAQYPPKPEPAQETQPVADFDKAIDKVLKVEGGFVNHPNDKGGATNHGITIGTLSQWRGRTATVEEVRLLSVDEAKRIYRGLYWNPLNLDGLHPAVSEVIFDQGVNFGVSAAARRVQHVINRITGSQLVADGKIGPATKAELQKLPWRKFVKEYIAEAQDHYVRIVVNNNSQIVFLAGWINRTQKLMDLLV